MSDSRKRIELAAALGFAAGAGTAALLETIAAITYYIEMGKRYREKHAQDFASSAELDAATDNYLAGEIFDITMIIAFVPCIPAGLTIALFFGWREWRKIQSEAGLPDYHDEIREVLITQPEEAEAKEVDVARIPELPEQKNSQPQGWFSYVSTFFSSTVSNNKSQPHSPTSPQHVEASVTQEDKPKGCLARLFSRGQVERPASPTSEKRLDTVGEQVKNSMGIGFRQ